MKTPNSRLAAVAAAVALALGLVSGAFAQTQSTVRDTGNNATNEGSVGGADKAANSANAGDTGATNAGSVGGAGTAPNSTNAGKADTGSGGTNARGTPTSTPASTTNPGNVGGLGAAPSSTKPSGGTTTDKTAVGGTNTDMTSAGNTNGGGMPQVQRQGDVAYVSGGVGSDEADALKSEARRWPLSMRFIGPGSEYLSDVHVRIIGSKNADVLQADARGPYMLVQLPPGRYTVHARYKDNDQTREVTVSKSPGARADFHWSTY
jgi:hypothetical protein